MPRIKFKAAQTIRFTYLHPPDRIDEATGDKYKEVFVLNPNWSNAVHGIDLKRLTAAEREVLSAVFNPVTKGKIHRIPLVNDILKRMDPIQEIKNPMSFYQKFVKVFLRNKDAYRVYDLTKMSNVTIQKESSVNGKVINPKPLFHKVESKAPPQKMDANRLELIRKVAAQKGVGVSKKVNQ